VRWRGGRGGSREGEGYARRKPGSGSRLVTSLSVARKELARKLTIPIHNLINPIRKDLLLDSCRFPLEFLIPSLLPMLPSILAMIKFTQKLKPIVHLITMLSSLPPRIHRCRFSPRNFRVCFDPEEMLTSLQHRRNS
jgi:hypothetical protein